MAQEISTIARPYAEAVFKRAVESDGLNLWSDMLDLLAKAVSNPALEATISNPKFGKQMLTGLILEIGGGRLSDEGQNLVKLLAENERLPIAPEIASQFEVMKAEREKAVDVNIISAFEIKPAEEKKISEALSKKLGRDIRLQSSVDPELIGGILVRAGDTVIDGSVAGQLANMRQQLGF